jgi:hypothetical protein
MLIANSGNSRTLSFFAFSSSRKNLVRRVDYQSAVALGITGCSHSPQNVTFKAESCLGLAPRNKRLILRIPSGHANYRSHKVLTLHLSFSCPSGLIFPHVYRYGPVPDFRSCTLWPPFSIYTLVTRIIPTMAEKRVVTSDIISVVSSTPSISWKGWLWDSADYSPEERRFLLKLDFTLLTFGTLGMLTKWVSNLNRVNEVLI